LGVPGQARTIQLAQTCIFVAFAGALLVAGAVFRSWGVLDGPLDLWADEAWWATLLYERELHDLGFRPIGYMWLSRLLGSLGDDALMLRLPSYLAGIVSLGLVLASARVLMDSRLMALFALLVMALHPALVVFAKEFKPYSLEVFIYSGFTLWALVCVRRRRVPHAFWPCAAAAIPFAYNIVFLIPALAAALHADRFSAMARRAMAAWRAVEPRRRILFALLGASAGLLLNSVVFRQTGAQQRWWYWGGKYDVFPVDATSMDWVGWYVEKTWALLSWPGSLRGMDWLTEPLFVAAYVLGVAVLAQRRRLPELAILCGPLACVAAANIIGYWPYGAFRTNLFLLPGVVLVACYGLAWLASRKRWRLIAYGAVIVITFAALSADMSYHRVKHIEQAAASPQMTEVLDAIQLRYRERPGVERNVIISDPHSWRMLHYYLGVNTAGRHRYADVYENVKLPRERLRDVSELSAFLRAECAQVAAGDRRARVWIVLTHQDRFGGIVSSSFVRDNRTHERRFATHDPGYHPLLIELVFAAECAEPGISGKQ
jgi:hypothetical protein